MKTRFKHLSKSSMAIVLALMMIVSTVTVGMFTTTAANVDAPAVGAAADTVEDAVGAPVDNTASAKTENGAALDSDTSDVNANSDSAVGAKVDKDSAVGSADVYYVKGSWSGSDWGAGTQFNASTKKATVTLAANTEYEFKIYSSYGNKWYGANNTFTGSQSEYYFNTSNGNAKIKTSAAGTYTFELKREDSNDGAVAIGITYPAAATTYTISKASTTNGSFTVSKTTATAGTRGITITASPNRGYQVNTVSVTGATVSGSGNTRYFDMPAQNVTVTVTFKTATAYTVTANQVTTGSGSIAIVVKSGSTTVASATATTSAAASVKAYSGETITVTATPSSGYSFSTMTRNGANVGAATYSGSAAANTFAATFTKATYANQYTATLGSTVTGNSSLYTKIKATYFDYKTDSEVSGDWIKSIKNNTDRGRYQATCEPYTKLNTALKNYTSSGTAMQYPIYFGNFYNLGDGYAGVSNSTNSYFKNKVNNSQGLGGENKAVPGLTGKTLSANGLPTYYQSGATNENGKEMKIFDKDWLSSSASNGQGVLANTIDAPFPVKKTGDVYSFDSNNGYQNLYFKNLPKAPYYTMDYLYCDVSSVNDDYQNIDWWAYYLQGPENSTLSASFPQTKWVQMTWDSSANCWKVPYDGDYKQVIFVRKQKGSGGNWDNAYNQTGDLTIPDGNTQAIKYKISGWGSPMPGYWQTQSVAQNSNGNTNAITLDYYENSNKVYSPEYHNAGFYPFDWGHVGHQAYDLGFGVSMEIPFTLGPNGCLSDGTTHQVFEFSGDDDLWVYVDDQLILDLGGDHKITRGKIDFADGKIYDTSVVTVNSASRNQPFTLDASKSVHTMKLFYLERGMFDSNLKFSFSMYPPDDDYDVQKIVDTTDVNAGIRSKIPSKTFSFNNTTQDGKGANANYDIYTVPNTVYQANQTTTNVGVFTLPVSGTTSRYAYFKKVFTPHKWLRTVESAATGLKYDTSYKVIDLLNNDAVVKQGSGGDTGQFTFFNSDPNVDPDLAPTHLRTIFTNKVLTSSFMVTKAIENYDDPDTAFPVYIRLSIPTNATNYTQINTTGLRYTTSADGYATPYKQLTSGGSNYGYALIHEGEYLLFEGIPEGAKVEVYEPTFGASSEYTVDGTNAEAASVLYKLKTISVNEESDNNATYTNKTTAGHTTEHTDVTFKLNSFDVVTIENTPREYRMDYVFESRLYGNKTYKYTGYMSKNMLTNGYIEATKTSASVKLSDKYVSDHIPYESKYMKNITWNAASTATTGTAAPNGDVYDSYRKLGSTADDKKLTVKIDTNGDGSYETTVINLAPGQSIKDTQDKYYKSTKTEGGEEVKASRWDIYTVAPNGARGSFVTSCYSYDFNYVAFDNYFVQAVFDGTDGHDTYNTFTSATVTNLGVTRSHWNDTTSGREDPNTYEDPFDTTKTGPQTYTFNLADTEYDRLYLDIALAFNAEGKMISTYDSSTVSVGYEILILNDDNSVKKTYKTINLANSALDNKNRIHAYYGFQNTANNRNVKLGIRAFVNYNGTKTTSNVMQFELGTEGSKYPV